MPHKYMQSPRPPAPEIATPTRPAVSTSDNSVINAERDAAANTLEPSEPNTYLDDLTFGADVSSATGDVTSGYNHGTTLQTIDDLIGMPVPISFVPGADGFRLDVAEGAGPLANRTTTEVGEDSMQVTSRTTLGDDAIGEAYLETAIGRTAVNERWARTDDSLAYAMTELLGTDEVDVVGLQDKWNLSRGMESTAKLPLSFATQEDFFTGHDVYAFQAADGLLSDEDRDAELAKDLASVDSIADLSITDLLDMDVGAGFAFVDDIGNTSDTSLTGRRAGLSLTVGFGSGDKEMQQTMLAITGPEEVTVSIMQGDGNRAADQLGIGVSKGNLSVGASVGTEVWSTESTSVEFKFDLSSEKGILEYENFRRTGLLPGAAGLDRDGQYQDDLAAYKALQAEMVREGPGSARYAELQAKIYEASGELNNTFMGRDTFIKNQDLVPRDVEYTSWRHENREDVTHSASLFAFEMSRVGRVEREWDRYDIDNGAFDLEAGFFLDDDMVEGSNLVVASPNSASGVELGTSSRVSYQAIEEMYKQGGLPKGALDPRLAEAMFEGGLDDFQSGGAQLTMALTEQHLAMLTDGTDVDALLAGDDLRQDIWERPRARDMEENIFGDIAANMGEGKHYSEDDLDQFYDTYGLQRDRWGGDEPTKIREQMLGTTAEDFQKMSPLEREVFLEVRASDLAVNNRNPWETLAIVQLVEDSDERTYLMRELFESIEGLNMRWDPYQKSYEYTTAGVGGGSSANTASFLLLQRMNDVSADLSPADQETMMSGVRIDMVDRRAQEWSNTRVLDLMQEGKSQGEVVEELIESHISWSIEHNDWDQLSDNFQAAALGGGPQMVNEIVEQMGEDKVIELLATTAANDPARIAIYHQAFAGTQYEGLIPEVDLS